MSLVTVTDAFLAARAAEGDEAAFAELARRYRPLIVSVAVGPPPGLEFEDLRQEALIALHDEAAGQGRFTKFIPASGAATRMFQDLLSGRGVEALLEAIERFAFVDDLRAELAFR